MVCLNVRFSLRLSVCPSVCPSVRLSAWPSVRLSASLSVSRCVRLSVCPPHSSLGRAIYTQLAWDFRNRVRTMRFTPRGQQGVCLLVHLVYWPIRILDRLRECAIYPSNPPGRPVGRHRIPCFPIHPSAYFFASTFSRACTSAPAPASTA